jgi:hypothetical protein
MISLQSCALSEEASPCNWVAWVQGLLAPIRKIMKQFSSSVWRKEAPLYQAEIFRSQVCVYSCNLVNLFQKIVQPQFSTWRVWNRSLSNLQQLQVNSCLQTCDLSSSWGVISGHFVHLQLLEAGSKWGPVIMHCCANAVVLLLTFCCSIIWNFLSQDSNSSHKLVSGVM